MTNKVIYFGHELSADGLRPDLLQMQGIHEMPPSITRDDLEAVHGIGMATHLGNFASNLAEVTAQLRDLTKKEIMCIWDAVRETSYEDRKQVLLKQPGPVLAYFDPRKDVVVRDIT